MARLQILYVDVIILVQRSAAQAVPHTRPSEASIQPTADPPQTIRVQIAVRTAEVRKDGEDDVWGRVGDRLADVAQNSVPSSQDVRRIGRKGCGQRIVR